METPLEAIEFLGSSPSSSNDEEDRRQRTTKCAALVVASAAKASDIVYMPMCGSSLPGKAKNRDKGILQGTEQIYPDCFNRSCLLSAPISEAEYERRFRMPRSVYEALRDGVLEPDRYFMQKRDAAGTLGAPTNQTLVCALRQLAYGVPADAFSSTYAFSSRPRQSICTRFLPAVRKWFEAEWLRRPNAEALVDMEQHYTKLGVSGFIRCIGVASWT
jgi:hypothetical protein